MPETKAHELLRKHNISLADVKERPETQYARSGDVMIAYQVTGAEHVIDLVIAPGVVSHLDLDWEWPGEAANIEWFSSFCRRRDATLEDTDGD